MRTEPDGKGGWRRFLVLQPSVGSNRRQEVLVPIPHPTTFREGKKQLRHHRLGRAAVAVHRVLRQQFIVVSLLLLLLLGSCLWVRHRLHSDSTEAHTHLLLKQGGLNGYREQEGKQPPAATALFSGAQSLPSGYCVDFLDSAWHTAVSHNNVFVMMADVVPLAGDEETPLMVSKRERERLRKQYTEDVEGSFISTSSGGGNGAAPASLLRYASEDHRQVQLELKESVHALPMSVLRHTPPLRRVMSFDDVKRAVVVYQPVIQMPSTSGSHTVAASFTPPIIELLRLTGVERHQHPLLKGRYYYSLAPPLVIHLSSIALPAWAEEALLGTPDLKASAVKSVMQAWQRFTVEQEAAVAAVQEGRGGSEVTHPRPPPPVPRRFILVSTAMDFSPSSYLTRYAPAGMTPNASVHALLDHPLLVHWHAQNCNIKGHPKFSCLPIGLHLKAGSLWSNPAPVPMISQQNDLLWSWFQSSRPKQGDGDGGVLSRRHPADGLQALLERIMGLKKSPSGDRNSNHTATAGEGGFVTSTFMWKHRRKWCRDEHRVAALVEDDTPSVGCRIPSQNWEEVVEVELLGSVLEELLSAPSAPGSGSAAAESSNNSTVKWVAIRDVIGSYGRRQQGEISAGITWSVRLVAPRLKMPDMIEKGSNMAQQQQRGEEADRRCGDDALATAPSVWTQLHCFGVVEQQQQPSQKRREITLLVPVPAVFALALQHHRPVGSQEHRRMAVVSAFSNAVTDPSGKRRLRRLVHSSLVANLPQSAVDTSGKLSHEAYLDSLQQNLFVASPPGSGYDCYRTWETLLLGGIPIILHPEEWVAAANTPISSDMRTHHGGVDVIHADSILELYEDLPVIVVRNYNFSMEQLEVWRAEVEEKRKRGVYRWEKLFTQYWLEKMGKLSQLSESME